MNTLKVRYNDGGRAAAGHKSSARDCVCRAIAIAAELPYQQVYDAINAGAENERVVRGGKRSNAATGVKVKREWFKKYMTGLGFEWVPRMFIGTGCKVHLRPGELPNGRLVVLVSRHYCAVIDGVIHDTHDPSRGGTRCVYGYWIKK